MGKAFFQYLADPAGLAPVDSSRLPYVVPRDVGRYCPDVSQRLIPTLYTSNYLTSLILHTTLEVFEGSSDDHYSVEQFPSFPLPSSLSVPSILVINLVPPSRQPVSQSVCLLSVRSSSVVFKIEAFMDAHFTSCPANARSGPIPSRIIDKVWRLASGV